MREHLLHAARLDEHAHNQNLLFGRAMVPDGFAKLQAPPCSLPAYAAARVRHALAHAPGVDDAEITTAAREYAAFEECALPPDMDRLVKMCTRAGAECPTGAALSFVWARSFDAATVHALPRVPHPFLREVLRAESRRLRNTLLG